MIDNLAGVKVEMGGIRIFRRRTGGGGLSILASVQHRAGARKFLDGGYTYKSTV
jgi:hypothetical protein